MSIVFFGASELGHTCCKALIDTGIPIEAIVTAPRQFDISYAPNGVENVLHRSFDDLARAHDIPIFVLKDGMRDLDLYRFLHDHGARLGIVIGWYHMVPRPIRELFPLGVVGLHASLLPKYRGGAPLVWALINQETETGVSLFRLEDGIDDGVIYGQAAFPIKDNEDIAAVLTKATEASANVVQSTVPRILDGSITPRAQDSESATTYPQRSPADGRIDWNCSTAEILAFIRAQTHPYPGAFTVVNGAEFRVWTAERAGGNGHPGTVLSHELTGTVIATKDGAVKMTDTQPTLRPPVGTTL